MSIVRMDPGQLLEKSGSPHPGNGCGAAGEHGARMNNRELLQAQLNAFYKTALAEARPLFDEGQLARLSAPLLVSISDAYLDSPVRIMFVGKETNGWWGKLRTYYATEDAADKLLACYRRQMAGQRWSGRFFQMVGRTARELAGAQVPAIAWTNLMRTDLEQGKGFSRNSKAFSEALTQVSRKMLRYEFDLLKPDVVIFACGPGYDSEIKAVFGDRTESEAIVPRALWHFKVGHTLCFRAQHPQAIHRKGSALKPVGFYYAEIFARVKASFPHVYEKAGETGA
ncbi:hypothetical protein [Variovorax sp. E3]|uniref:hypothetical protein n=1 Tax=Variovorax sp. E3 TaxID=1914993 RepID=UPI0022B60D54|nr:hypothetical protein [Variovorax sp. E3]